MRLRISKLFRIALYALGILCILYLAAVGVLRTAGFKRFLLHQAVSGIEQLTGARVEISQLSFDPHSLQVAFRGLVLHGTELPSEPALFSADSLVVLVNPLSVLRRKLLLRRVDLENAAIHVVHRADGSTNFPGPIVRLDRATDAFLNLSVSGVTLSRTILYWDDAVVPLELSARDVTILLHRTRGRRYSGNFSSADIRLECQGLQTPPVTLSTRLEFSRNDLELTGLEWRLAGGKGGSGGIAGSGTMAFHRLPFFKAIGSIRAHGEILTIASVLQSRLPQLGSMTGGDFSLVGSASYSKDGVQSRGHVEAREVGIESSAFRLKRVALSSDYSAHERRVEFPHLSISALDGEARGHAECSFITGSAPTFAIRTEVRGISLAEALQAAPRGREVIHHLPVAAGVDGTLEASWSGKLHDFASRYDIRLSRQINVPSGFRPLTGSVRGTTTIGSRPSLVLDNVEFHLPHSSFTARGKLEPEQSSLAVQLQTTDFEEVRDPIQHISDPPLEIPLRLDSAATFSGAVSGPWSGPLIRGRLKVGAFDLRSWRWDGFEGTVTTSPTLIQLSGARLTAAGNTLAFEGWAGLENWQVFRGSALHVFAQANGAAMERLQSVVNLHYPVTGVLTGVVNVEGTPATLQGSGRVRLARGTLKGESFDWLTAQFRVARGVWDVPIVELAKGSGRVTGRGQFQPSKGALSGQLHGSGLQLSELKLLAPHPYRPSGFTFAEQLSGDLSFEAQAQGSLQSPRLQSRFDVRSLSINAAPAGNFHGQLTWQQTQIQFQGLLAEAGSGTSPAGDSPSSLHFGGNSNSAGDWPFQLELHYSNFRLDPWIDLFRGQSLGAALVATGSATASGPLKRPGFLKARGEATSLEIAFPSLKWKSDRPVEFSYSNWNLSASRFRLRGPSTDLEMEGSIKLKSPATLAFTAQGHGDATGLTIFEPGIEAAGSFDVNLHASGAVSKPRLNGSISVNNLGLAYGGLPFRVAGLNGEIKLEGDRATISSLRGTGGPSAIAFSGTATISGTPQYDLQASLERARIGFPSDFTSVLTGSLRLTGAGGSSRLTGDLGVTQMFVSEDFNLLAWMGELSAQVARQTSAISRPLVSPFATNTRLDVQVTSQPQVHVESPNLDAVADIDVNLRGTLANPAAFGSVHIESGSAVIRGDRYRITRGDITMNNPFRTELNVDMEARTRVQDYELTLDVSGPADRTRISYRSDPPLPTEDILSLLALGYTREEQGLAPATNRPFGSVGASALLSQALSSQTSGRLQRLFGVSRIKVDPNVSGPLASGGPRVTVEERVARDFSVTYSQNTSGAQQRVVQMNWDVSDRVSLIGDRDQNGVFGLELRLRHRFK